jgi:hypothetical protein
MNKNADVCQSLDSNIFRRAKNQREEIKKMCSSYQTNYSVEDIFSVVTVNFHHRVAVCHALQPHLFFTFQLLNESHLSVSKYNLTEHQLFNLALRTFYTFTIVQNPMERLLNEYGRLSLNMSLTNFLLNLLHLPFEKWNISSAPTYLLCSPCKINYDFFTSTKTLEYDLPVVLRSCGVSDHFIVELYRLLKKINIKKFTNKELSYHYSKVPFYLKTKLFNKLHMEFEYYYTLYPEERGMHLQFLRKKHL